MELTNYIDADEGRMEAEPAEAAYECFNCGRACDELHHVPEFDYMGCQECLDEAMELLAREAAGKELYPAERQILAAAGLRPCVHCKTKIAAGIRSTAATSSSRRSCVPCVRRWRSGHHSFSDQHPEGTAPAVPRGPHRREPVRRRAAHVQFRGGRVLRVRHRRPHPRRAVPQARRARGRAC